MAEQQLTSAGFADFESDCQCSVTVEDRFETVDSLGHFGQLGL